MVAGRRMDQRCRCCHRGWRVWRAGWSVVAVPGVAVGLLVLSPPAVVLAVALSAVSAVALRAMLVQDSAARRVAASWCSCQHATTTAYVISAVVLTLGMLGYGAVSGAATFLLLAAGGVSSPGFLGWARMSAGLPVAATQGDLSVSTRTVELPAAELPSGAVEAMREARAHASSLDDVDLCLAWRRSYSLLQRTSTCAQRSAVVLTRQAYLDELAERDATAITAWLEAGARAASGPERFMQRAEPGS